MDEATAGAADEAVAARSTRGVRPRVLAIAKIAFTVIVVAAVGYATAREWPAVRETVAALSWPYLLFSYVAVVLGLLAQARSMRVAFGELGHPIDGRSAAKIYLVGLLGKYLPGSVWTFVMQMELGRRAGIPRARGLLAPLICLALSTTSAMVLGLFVLPGLGSSGVGTFVIVTVAILVPVSLAVAHPRVLNWLVGRFLVLTRREPLSRAITGRGILLIIGWSTLAWILFGTSLWLLAGDSAASGPAALARCIGTFGLALTVGTLAFLSPSGVGVREAVIVGCLLPVVPSGVALAMALASRAVFTVADVTAAGAAALAETGRMRRLLATRQGAGGDPPLGL